MTIAFLGRWLVSEYIFGNDGAYLGVNRQQRELEQIAADRIRVVQRCEPEPALAEHPMGAFAGEWQFDLTVDGQVRRYHGPDVIGGAVGWAEGAMTGRGVWPRFGHNFASWSLMLGPDRQLTGGRFFNAAQCVAHIVGVGQLAESAQGQAYPALRLECVPADLATEWRGMRTRFDAAGACLGEEAVTRTYSREGWREAGWEVVLAGRGPCYRVEGTALRGIAARTGPMLELEAVLDDGTQVTMMEVLDAATRSLVGIHRLWRDEQMLRLAVVRMTCPA